MKNIIVYSGQGNVSVKDLSMLEKSEKGIKILEKLRETDLDAFELFYNVLRMEVSLSDPYASMLCTFLYNEWKTDYSIIDSGTIFSAHSAGIFNVLLSSDSADFSSIVDFIKGRARLLTKINRSEKLWMILGKDVLSKIPHIKYEFKGELDCAIITDENSLVLAMDSRTKRMLADWFKFKGLTVKIVDLKVRAPYHTRFLEVAMSEYIDLVSQLNIHQNADYRYIFESSNLEEEIINQWSSTFKWNEIKDKIIALNVRVVDVSPNKFITKQLKKQVYNDRR